MISLRKQVNTLLLAATFLVAMPFCTAQPNTSSVQTSIQPAAGYTKPQVIDLVNQIAAESPYMPPKLSNLLEQMNQNSTGPSFEETLQKIVATLLAIKITPEQRAQLNQIQSALIKNLQTYKVSGTSLAADWNGGFFVDTQDPRFTVTYKDARGNTKTRTYQADISLVGLNVELALRLNLIFFVGTDFNFHESNKVIELGKGMQVNPGLTLSLFSNFFLPLKLENIDYPMLALSLFDLTYVPFTNTSGGLFIASIVFGYPFLRDYISLVTGGTLTPVA